MQTHSLPSAQSSETFYLTLPEFSGVDNITDQGYYREKPDDWLVLSPTCEALPPQSHRGATKRSTPSALLVLSARYIASLCRNNDYLKLDDYLRMVIDVTQAQRKQIETLLDRYANTHCLVWGGHFSETALFTCTVKSEQIRLHFVDGNNGGYTAAARDMEARETARRLAQNN